MSTSSSIADKNAEALAVVSPMARPLNALTGPLLRAAVTLLAARHGGQLSILIYHRVLPERDAMRPTEVTASEFKLQMLALREHFRPLPLSEAVRRLREGSLPSRACAVTFDDGYADNADIAVPILRDTGVPACFFIATGYLDGGRMFNDSVLEALRLLPAGTVDLERYGLGQLHLGEENRARDAGQLLQRLKYLPPVQRADAVDELVDRVRDHMPDNLMMRSEQLPALVAAGMEVGAHTVSHPILTRIEPAEARREMSDSRALLQELVSGPVNLFAYPNGRRGDDYDAAHACIARELGFEAAVTTNWGASNRSSDPWQLPRFTPWDREPRRFVARLARNLLN